MDERIRFVARLLDGHNMSEVCREFGISRKTGPELAVWSMGAVGFDKSVE